MSIILLRHAVIDVAGVGLQRVSDVMSIILLRHVASDVAECRHTVSECR